jgi:hypothetical protein
MGRQLVGDHLSARRRPVLLVTVALLLSGCSGGGEASGPGSVAEPPGASSGSGTGATGSTGAELAFDSPDADDFNLLVVAEDGLVDLKEVEILGVDASDSRQLVVSFEMGSHHCHGVQVAVDESGAEVVLDLRTGRRPGVSPGACAYGVFPYTTEVALARPLGERAVSTSAAPDRDQAEVDPAAVDPAGIDVTDVDIYLGRPIEDGVEWALANDRPWRILSQDGEPVDDVGPADPDRISFVVEADLIVGYEWS